MMVLVFADGQNRYALDTARVVEVVPAVPLRSLPHAPAALAGLLTYRGQVVGVVDLCRLLTGHACPPRLNSRIILTRVTPPGGPARLVGLMAEQVMHIHRLPEGLEVQQPVALPAARYLGGIYRDDQGLVQFIGVDDVLEGELAAALLQPPQEAAP